jgi:hypothetical protein
VALRGFPQNEDRLNVALRFMARAEGKHPVTTTVIGRLCARALLD